MLANFGLKIRLFWDYDHENWFLTFLENKRLFLRTTYIRLLIYLKATYRQKMKAIDFSTLATRWSIFPDRRSYKNSFYARTFAQWNNLSPCSFRQSLCNLTYRLVILFYCCVNCCKFLLFKAVCRIIIGRGRPQKQISTLCLDKGRRPYYLKQPTLTTTKNGQVEWKKSLACSGGRVAVWQNQGKHVADQRNFLGRWSTEVTKTTIRLWRDSSGYKIFACHGRRDRTTKGKLHYVGMAAKKIERCNAGLKSPKITYKSIENDLKWP